MQRTDLLYLLRTGNVRKETVLKYSDYIVVAAEAFKENDERLGQTYFNVLVELRPEIAEEIRGTDLDAFFDNDKLPAMLNYVYKRWQ